ncbi:MAG: Glu-tRNA(Gln) amidotransferase subunit GatE [Planctomycetes bacterium]|jgi:glutamyl-tRNA(Gln) amidotransferase subunit E|nr:Glu-tRNA(Gln) amidotransferase subunit GatE [Planctomycetota bacterium]
MPITPRRIPAPEETDPSVYRDLGLKSGLEVHQQLLTARKLFCRCPAGPYRADYDAEILRHMRPTLSEMGEYDGTALMEKKTRKEVVYQITGDTTCTYEMDDTPPFKVNGEAVDIAIEIALLLGTSIVGELHIARKQYLDGSIPTGFQRTAIVGLAGRIPYGDRTIGITQISLEEDACREVEDRGHLRVYRTDRLSRPLIETVTDPDMKTPGEVADVCRIIARLARGTGKVRTGIGAGREDVNVSVTGGTRVEIKGVPRIPRIPGLVHYEAFRQRALLDIVERLKEKGLSAESFRTARRPLGAGDVSLPLPSIEHARSGDGDFALLVLPGFREILPWPVGPTRTFADELSGHIRVVACLDQLPNMLFEGDGHANEEFWGRLRRDSAAGPDDALVVVFGPAPDVTMAAGEIEARCRQAFRGVPNETRQALANGETRFERVLPGPERMYPDTDLPPLAIPDERLERIRAATLPPVWDREKWLRALGVPAHEAVPLAISRRYTVFRRAVEEQGASPKDGARVLISLFVALRREGCAVDGIPDTEIDALFGLFAGGRFAREIFPALLRAMAAGRSAKEAVAGIVGPPAPRSEVEPLLRGELAASTPAPEPERRARHILGGVMPALRGRIAGAEVRRMLAGIAGEVRK